MPSESLRLRLLLRLASVLLVLLSLDALACYYTALHFANLVYDRWLIDSDRSLATAVHAQNGQVVLDLPRAALDVFRFDAIDNTYYRLDSEHSGLIAGDPALKPAGSIPAGSVYLRDSQIGGRPVRMVSTRVPNLPIDDAVTMSVAETLAKRSTLTREIVLAMIAPQIALLGVGLGLAWLNVNRGLKPLTDLAKAIEARDADNLISVPEKGLPKEARILAARLNKLFAQVNEAIQSQDNFVADAAHQLRTPLAAVVLHADAVERATDSAGQQRAIRSLRVSVDRAARLSQQLLLLMRSGPAAAAGAHLIPVDLSELVRSVGEEWVPQMLAHNVDFGLAVPATAVRVRADASLLSELLSNLLDNARRYGKPSGRITLGVVAGPAPALYVEDDGPGIAAAEQGRILERFYRLPGTAGEGCGLGLAIVKDVALLHRAVVRVHSDSQLGGTRISVVFEHAVGL